MTRVLPRSFSPCSIVAVLACTALVSPVLPAAQYSFLDEECDPSFSLMVRLPKEPVHVVWNYRDEGNHLGLELKNGRLTAWRARDGQRTSLLNQQVSGMVFPLTVQRLEWRLRIAAGKRTVLRAADDTEAGGRIGIRGPSSQLEGLRYQPMEPVHMEDDFMRGEEETGDWEPRSGEWKTDSVEVHGSVPSMSSNPFSLRAMAPEGVALSTAGYWFWTQYSVAASVRPQADGWVGIAACMQADGSGLLFRWRHHQTGDNDSAARQIVLLDSHGKPAVLASAAGGYMPGEWYRLELRCDGRYVQALVDGRTALTAETDWCGYGRVGLYADHIASVSFDDVRVEHLDTVRDGFSSPRPGLWRTVSGASARQQEALTLTRKGKTPALVVTRGVGNSRQTVSCRFRTSVHTVAGAVAKWRAANDYLAARVRVLDDGRARAALVRIAPSGTETLAVHTFPISTQQWRRLELITDQGLCVARVDGRPVVVALDLRDGGAGVGLEYNGPGAGLFDDFAAAPLPEHRRSRVNDAFANDQLMTDWSTASGAWKEPVAWGDRFIHWRLGNYYEDARVVAPLKLTAESPLEIRFASQATGDDQRAEAATLQYNADAGILHAQLAVNGKSNEKAVASVPAGAEVAFRRQQGMAWLTVDGRPVVGAPAADNSDGPFAVGVVTAKAQVPLDQIDVASEHQIDTTFDSAPIGFYSTRGIWETTNRWNCKRDWGFFGGKESEVPTLWTKQSFPGDVMVEAYVGLAMDLPAGPGYSHPSDINVTISADGKNLDSGYSFVFAGWNNKHTRLLRRDEVVANNDELLFVNPVSRNFEFHRHWFHLVVSRRGNQLRCWVDGKRAAEYTDPNPLDGGRIAFWSLNNSPIIARVRIWHQGDAAYPPLPSPGLPDACPTEEQLQARVQTRKSPLRFGFDADTGEFHTSRTAEDPVLVLQREGKRTYLRVLNHVSGGSLATLALGKPLPLSEGGRIRFDYRIQEGVQVNLYVLARGRYHVLVLSGESPGRATRLPGKPKITNLANGWKRCEYDLHAGFKELYTETDDIEITQIAFASPAGDYLRAGFGGNHWGSAYDVDSFELLPSK